jgi:hypothetical protein
VAIGNIRTRQRDIEQLWGSIVEALHGIDPIDA